MATTTASYDPQFQNIPIRSLVIAGVAFPIVVREAKFTRVPGSHDGVTMSVLFQGEMTFNGGRIAPLDSSAGFSGTNGVVAESLPGQPILFSYGVAPQVDTFYGYILSITPDQKFKQGLNYVITMVGATIVSQRVNRRFYTNISLPELAKRCTDRAALGLDIGADLPTYRWPSYGNTVLTDWELLGKLAEFTGGLLLNWMGVVQMQRPLTLLQRYPFTVLTSSDDLLEKDRKLLDFKPVEKSSHQIATQPRRYYFFDPSGAVTYHDQPSAQPAVYTPVSTFPVRNREEAEIFSASSDNDLSRWLHSATARIRGDASIYPGVTVDVNTGTRATTARFNGRWLVVGVSHSMARDAFSTELNLARPGSLIPPLTRVSFENFWRFSDRSKPLMSLGNGEWVSSWADTYEEVQV